jgi:hypothetical protein
MGLRLVSACSNPQMAPHEIYGAEHLLRLVVSLPRLLSDPSNDPPPPEPEPSGKVRVPYINPIHVNGWANLPMRCPQRGTRKALKMMSVPYR